MDFIKRKIAVVSVARSDFSIVFPLLKILKESERIDLDLYLSGGHLSKEQGNTYQSVVQAGFSDYIKIEIGNSNTAHDCNVSISSALSQYSEAFQKNRPDCIVITGDRFDMFPAALAAVTHKIPICHIHGGEVTSGAFDDQFRHAITKFSHIHCVAHKEYGERVLHMGEEPWRVLVSGALALDNIEKITSPGREEVFRKYNLRPEEDLQVITFHPETIADDSGESQLEKLLTVLKDYPSQQLFTMSNIDPQSHNLRCMMEEYMKINKNAQMVKSVGLPGYYHLLSHASVVIGNSSSGILETPSFAVPCINIGDRQKGRIAAKNIISCKADCEDMKISLEKALSDEFRKSLVGMNSPFFFGGAGEKIYNFILECLEREDLTKKLFYDFPSTH